MRIPSGLKLAPKGRAARPDHPVASAGRFSCSASRSKGLHELFPASQAFHLGHLLRRHHPLRNLPQPFFRYFRLKYILPEFKALEVFTKN